MEKGVVSSRETHVGDAILGAEEQEISG